MLVTIDNHTYLETDATVVILAYGSNPIKRLKHQTAESGHLIDGTNGRKTRSVIITETGHVILSHLTSENLGRRIAEALANAPSPPALSLLANQPQRRRAD